MQLSQTTQQNASSSEELAATSEEMSGQAEQLQQLMAFFKVEAGVVAHAPMPAAASARRLLKSAPASRKPRTAAMMPVRHSTATAGEIDESEFSKY